MRHEGFEFIQKCEDPSHEFVSFKVGELT